MKLSTRQKYTLSLAALVVIGLILFPPYFGVDTESEGRIHGFIGYRPIWSPPTSEQVQQVLVANGFVDLEADRKSSFEARLNFVRLGSNIFVLVLVTVIALIVLRDRRIVRRTTSMDKTRKLILFFVVGHAVVASAGIPPAIHSGRVLDSETGGPVIGVEVLGFPDEWPDDVPRKATSICFSDSTGVYSSSLNRPGNIQFFKAGYDSLVLHWPEEFEGSTAGGCGITLGPVYLIPTSR